MERVTGPPPLVLVVDDYLDAREMYALSLQMEGYRVVVASTGDEAIALARLHGPQAILMDLSLPGTDGLEAIRQLKADSRTRHIPVLAISGQVAEGVARVASEAGCDGFFLRPVPVSAVVGELGRMVAAGARGPSAEAIPS